MQIAKLTRMVFKIHTESFHSLRNGYPIFYHILPNLLEIVSLKKGQRLPQRWCCPESPGHVAYGAPLCPVLHPIQISRSQARLIQK